MEVDKLCQRGMGWVGAIIAMVVAGLIVYGIIYYGPSIWREIQKGTQGIPGGAPLYPGAELYEPEYLLNWDAYWKTILPAGWSGRQYKVSAEVNTIADWYRVNMSSWNLETDTTDTMLELKDNHFENVATNVKLVFTSGDATVAIYVSRALLGGGNRFVICAGPRDGIPYLPGISPGAG